MQFQWDEAKRRLNILRHGIDFRDAEGVFAGQTVTLEDTRHAYGEQRLTTFGLLHGRTVAIVHTERHDSIRVISMRKATKHEERSYFAQI